MDDNKVLSLAKNLKTIIDSTDLDKIESTIENYLKLFDPEISKKVHVEYFKIFYDSVPLDYLISVDKGTNYFKCLSEIESLGFKDLNREWSMWSKALIESIRKDFKEFEENKEEKFVEQEKESITK